MRLSLLKNKAGDAIIFPLWACLSHASFLPSEGRVGISMSWECPGEAV